MKAVRQNVKDVNVIIELDKLEDLWRSRTHHGANKQRFGLPQEVALDELVSRNVPEEDRPKKNKQLEFNSRFATYVKSVIWNRTKSLGKNISKLKGLRSGMVSLSEYEHMASL